MTLNLNLPITLSIDGADHAGILLRVQDGENLFLLVEGLLGRKPPTSAPRLRVNGDQVPEQTLSPLQEASGEGDAWTHLATLASSAETQERWFLWLSSHKNHTALEIAFLDQLMSNPTGKDDPFGFNTDDSAETRDVDDGERQSLLAALRDSMSQPDGEATASFTPSVSEETGDWLDGLGDDLGGIEVNSPPPVSEADFEALLDEDSSMVALAMEGDEDDWTEDSVNWQQDTEDTLLEGPATLEIQGGYERLAVLGGPPEFQDQKDVPDDFEPSAEEPEVSPQGRLEARQAAELAALIGDEASSSVSSEEQTGFADLVGDDPPAGFSVPASAEDFAELLDNSEPEPPDVPNDPRYERDGRGLHVHWESIEALSRDYDAELSRKRLTVYREDAPAPGTPMTLWLHLPDEQVLALSARLAGADADRFELRLDLPLVTKGKLKRVARSQ
ncbi:MAG: hypothetical protein ACI9VR_002440 [Cognaticolwellia sp.]|jgi:hypothetical protein